ncbi:alpha/beta hydrolase [Rossellomorea vietnamensis]|uniref:alpha/beta fold hydrolase n=1 Tax=Rossellomorea vietnamensis TaxID=218284 RepID=UPI001CC97AB6|nr:alpha/beta hydrolase [Rossellomorea vietnamensis]MCA0149913.1 alpha/beta hydrolase [Rossellomorea vietnamensis]
MNREMLVPIKNFNLYAKLTGKKNNKPTVVMDAGYGDYSKAWDSVIGELSEITEVLVYDRAGLGKSGKSPSRRTSREMVKELKELLIGLNIKPPYIMVGHSFGGVNVSVYAHEYPEEVAGLVLVDSTPVNYRERFLPTMTSDFQAAYRKQFVREGNYEEFMESLGQLKEYEETLSMPVLVLSAGKKDHYSEASQELWNDMQRELALISSKGECVLAKNSAHYIQRDEPQVVIKAVEKLIELHSDEKVETISAINT